MRPKVCGFGFNLYNKYQISLHSFQLTLCIYTFQQAHKKATEPNDPVALIIIYSFVFRLVSPIRVSFTSPNATPRVCCVWDHTLSWRFKYPKKVTGTQE